MEYKKRSVNERTNFLPLYIFAIGFFGFMSNSTLVTQINNLHVFSFQCVSAHNVSCWSNYHKSSLLSPNGSYSTFFHLGINISLTTNICNGSAIFSMWGVFFRISQSSLLHRYINRTQRSPFKFMARVGSHGNHRSNRIFTQFPSQSNANEGSGHAPSLQKKRYFSPLSHTLLSLHANV